MKNNGLFNFFGCCVIAIAIVIAGVVISNNLPETAKFPTSLSVQPQSVEQQFGDYLSLPEAAAYMRITNEDMTILFESGDIDGTMVKVGENYVISKQALQEWINSNLQH